MEKRIVIGYHNVKQPPYCPKLDGMEAVLFA